MIFLNAASLTANQMLILNAASSLAAAKLLLVFLYTTSLAGDCVLLF